MGINEFKNGYQPRAYVIKKDDGAIVEIQLAY